MKKKRISNRPKNPSVRREEKPKIPWVTTTSKSEGYLTGGETGEHRRSKETSLEKTQKKKSKTHRLLRKKEGEEKISKITADGQGGGNLTNPPCSGENLRTDFDT